MSETKVTLTVEQQNGAEDALNTSNTVIQTDSLADLLRMLQLAGVGGAAPIEVPAEEVPAPPAELPQLSMAPVEPEMDEAVGEPYMGLTSKPGVNRDIRMTSGYGDNALAEDSDERQVADTYHHHRNYHDHGEALARTADEHGVSGEQVLGAVKSHRAYEFESQEPQPAMEGIRGFKDYLKEFQEFKAAQVAEAPKDFSTWYREVKELFFQAGLDTQSLGYDWRGLHQEGMTPQAVFDELYDSASTGGDEEETYEAYGSFGGRQQRMPRGLADPNSIALLPCPGMFNLETLGTNEYFGDDLQQGKSGIVVFALQNPDGSIRNTFASTYGSASEYKPGEKYLTYHDQNPSKARDGTVLLTFSGKEWASPEGRAAIAQRMKNAGLDYKRKLSVRVFK